MAAATYAVVKIGGKQYSVKPGDNVEVELIEAPTGDTIEFGEVLALVKDGTTTVGTPLVEGARVTADVASHGRDKKIIVFHFKSKTRYRRRQGHRQSLTRLTIRDILGAGESAPKAQAPVAEAVTTEATEGTAEVKTTRKPRATRARTTRSKKTDGS